MNFVTTVQSSFWEGEHVSDTGVPFLSEKGTHQAAFFLTGHIIFTFYSSGKLHIIQPSVFSLVTEIKTIINMQID